MANSYLNKTFSGNGSTTKFTASFWVKRSKIGARQEVIAKWSSGSNNTTIRFLDDDTLAFVDYASSTTVLGKTTNRKFRDTSAWYHIVCNIDTTQASSDDRAKIYVNGLQETSFASNTVYSQNASTNWNNTWSNQIGWSGNDGYFDGYISHVALVDGTALTPTSFGETDSTSGIWKFKSPSGITWGTNGVHLKFENSGALGTDSSGNSNTFTVNGNLKQALDTPSNNHATFNPLLDVNAKPTFSNGDTTMAGAAISSAQFTGSNLCVSTGKWYYEVKVTPNSSSPYVGIIDAQSNLRKNASYFVHAASGINDSGYAVNMSGDIYHNNSNTYATNIGSISSGDILGFAIDLDSAQRTCEIYKNGTSMRTFNIAEPSSGFYMLACCSVYNTASASVNFGNGFFGTTAITSAGSNGNGSLFEYDVPSGYYALNTKNINTYG